MKMTLLEMTQKVLGSIKGDQVDDISETEEASLVADIIQECYYGLIAESDLLEEKTLFELEASNDLDKPVLMSLPNDVIGLEWVRYNIRGVDESSDNYKLLTYLDLPSFLDWTQQLKTENDGVATFQVETGTLDTIDFYYRDDKAPQYYTSFDDRQIVFDSFDSEVESTLQKNKTQAYGLKESSWTKTNNFIPALDSQQFHLLLQESKAQAWAELRQTSNALAERKARRNWILLSKKKDRVNYNHKSYYEILYPDYGMKR